MAAIKTYEKRFNDRHAGWNDNPPSWYRRALNKQRRRRANQVVRQNKSVVPVEDVFADCLAANDDFEECPPNPRDGSWYW